MPEERPYHPMVIRKHPLVVLRNFLVLEIASIVAFFVVAQFTHYEMIYNRYALASYLSFRLAEIFLVTLVELIIVSAIFLWWFFETYEFIPSGVIHKQGIIIRKRTVTTFGRTLSVSVIRNPFSKMFNFGTVVLSDHATSNDFKISYIGDPETYVSMIHGEETGHSKKEFSEVSLKSLIASRETETVEFKSTFRWDIRQGKASKEMEHAVIKTIAAFLNSKGGHLVIGIDDDGKVVGLDYDYKSLKKQNADGFEIHFTHIFNKCIGAEFRDLIRIKIETIEGKEVAVVSVLPCQKPVYVIGETSEHFFIRTGNATTDLSFRQAASYIESHWKKTASSILKKL